MAVDTDDLVTVLTERVVTALVGGLRVMNVKAMSDRDVVRTEASLTAMVAGWRVMHVNATNDFVVVRTERVEGGQVEGAAGLPPATPLSADGTRGSGQWAQAKS